MGQIPINCLNKKICECEEKNFENAEINLKYNENFFYQNSPSTSLYIQEIKSLESKNKFKKLELNKEILETKSETPNKTFNKSINNYSTKNDKYEIIKIREKNHYNIDAIIFIQKTFLMYKTRKFFISNLDHFYLGNFYNEMNKKGHFISIEEMLNFIPEKIKNLMSYNLKTLNEKNFYNSNINKNYIKKFKYPIQEQPFKYKDNKTIYYGEFNYKGEKNGYGIIILSDSSIYEGNFLYDKINGKGKIIYLNGSYYEGDFVNYIKKGKGKFFFNDGTFYEGDFNNDKIEGFGFINFNNGKSYKGEFKNNLIDGKGEFIYNNNSKYIGEFKNNLRNGFGIYYYDFNEKIFYQGNWINGFQEGKGEFCFSNGMKYNGFFKKGKIVSLINNKEYNSDNNNLSYINVVNINHFNNCNYNINISHDNSDYNINNKEGNYKINVNSI